MADRSILFSFIFFSGRESVIEIFDNVVVIIIFFYLFFYPLFFFSFFFAKTDTCVEETVECDGEIGSEEEWVVTWC